MKPQFGNADHIALAKMTVPQLEALARKRGLTLRKWNAQRKYDLRKWLGRFPMNELRTVKSGLTFVETAQFLMKGESNDVSNHT
jgi:hypothetical protein